MKYVCLTLILIFSVILAVGAKAEEQYTFDVSEIEKKPWHFGGYLELKPVFYGLDRDAAFYKLRFYRDSPGETTSELNAKLQLEGSFEKESFRLYVKTNTDFQYGDSGGTERSAFYEAYGSLKPSSSWTVTVGKKTLKWGKGYAWNPVAFVDRPKNPDDPEVAQEGYIVASMDWIKSFDGPLKTISLTPVILPVYDHINDSFGDGNTTNFAGRLYLLFFDTDIDLIFLTGASKTARWGVDFSRNITTNFEIHGEAAYIRNSQKNVLDVNGSSRMIQDDVTSYLIGLRYLTNFDLTTIVEYYHNGTGYGTDELKNFYAFINRGYNAYKATGNAAPLISAQNMADGGYGRFSPGKDYLYVRLSQKEPLDILYFTPALTWMMNLNDRSYALTPELQYTGITNLDLRFRVGWIVGGRDSEYGEKQNDYRIEFRAGYSF